MPLVQLSCFRFLKQPPSRTLPSMNQPRLDVSVIAERRPDGRYEVFLYDPGDHRAGKIGHYVEAHEKDAAVRRIVDQARANGLRVTVRET